MTPIKVLDHGSVQLIENWGSDQRVIEAARQSTGKGFLGWDSDEKLLAYLYNNKHSTPFEMCGLTIQVKAPIFVFREWHRHRTQSYNEMSARYVPMPDEHYIPSTARIMEGANAVTSNKQAQGLGKEPMDWHTAASVQVRLRESYRIAQENYIEMLALGTPKELARLVIPVARYSKMMASANLRNWLAFLTLRNAPNAQWEIQEYAKAVDSILTEIFPRTMELFHK